MHKKSKSDGEKNIILADTAKVKCSNRKKNHSLEEQQHHVRVKKNSWNEIKKYKKSTHNLMYIHTANSSKSVLQRGSLPYFVEKIITHTKPLDKSSCPVCWWRKKKWHPVKIKLSHTSQAKWREKQTDLLIHSPVASVYIMFYIRQMYPAESEKKIGINT